MLATAVVVLAAVVLTTIRAYGALGGDDPGAGRLLTIAAALFMAVGFVAAARRATGEARRAWRWFAVGGITYVLAELTWGVQYLVAGVPDGASIADALWLTSYSFFFLAFYVRSRAALRALPRGEGLIEVLIVIGLFGILTWRLVVEPTFSAQTGLVESAVLLAYPAWTLTLLWMLLREVYRSPSGSWSASQGLLATGLIVHVVATIVWATTTGVYTISTDLLFALSTLALGGAGFASRPAGSEAKPRRGRASRSRPLAIDLVPYIAGIAVGLVPIWMVLTDTRDVGLTVGAGAVLMLVFLRLAIAVRENRRLLVGAEATASLDELTGLSNHRYFQERLGEELARARRAETSVGLLMIDIDRLKEVNDAVGHLGGDRLLSELGQALRTMCRPSDTPCRVGSGELALIVPGATRTTLETVAERILQLPREIRFAKPDAVEGGYVPVTLSVGGSIFPDDASDQRSLAENADRALHQSKRGGRGRSTIYEPELEWPASPDQELAAAERQIRMRELDLSRVFTAAPDPILILSSAGDIVDANPATCGLTGLSAGQLRKGSIWDFLPDERAEPLRQMLDDEQPGTAEQATEAEVVLPDGGVRLVELSVTPFPPDRHLLAMRDITEQRAALAQVAESEEKFRSLFENAADAIYVLDDDGRILDANAAGVDLAGVGRERLIGTRSADLVDVDDRGWIDAAIERIGHDGGERGVYEGVFPNGARRAVEYASVANFLPGRHLSIVRDVTERVAARREVAEREAVFRAAVDTIDEGLVVVGPDGFVRSGSPAAARILGISGDELVGSSVLDPEWDIVDAEGCRLSAAGSPELEALRIGERLAGVTLGVRRPDGARVWVEANVEMIEASKAVDEPMVVASFAARGGPDNGKPRPTGPGEGEKTGGPRLDRDPLATSD